LKESLHVKITNGVNAQNFDIKGTVHFEFFLQGQTVNQTLYGNTGAVA